MRTSNRFSCGLWQEPKISSHWKFPNNWFMVLVENQFYRTVHWRGFVLSIRLSPPSGVQSVCHKSHGKVEWIPCVASSEWGRVIHATYPLLWYYEILYVQTRSSGAETTSFVIRRSARPDLISSDEHDRGLPYMTSALGGGGLQRGVPKKQTEKTKSADFCMWQGGRG